MKPFDLETYKKDPSREVVTRNGYKARIICTDRIGGYPVIALIENDEKDECIISYTESGNANHGYTELLDLFFVSVKHQGWINIYKDKQGFSGEKIYETEESAKNASLCIISYVTTIPIEWEE